MHRTAVIIPAAGAGTRYGGRENKIFRPLAGRPIFLRTLDLFADRPQVTQMLVTVSRADFSLMRDRYGAELDRLEVELAAGGATRSESVANALAQVAEGTELVCVHDAVRPCTAAEHIEAVFAEAVRRGAAILASPVRPTLKRVENGRIVGTVDREGLWEAQTPQVFGLGVLRAAYASGGQATDDAALVEMAGHDVGVVAGDAMNIKITTPADLAMAEAILASRAAGRET